MLLQQLFLPCNIALRRHLKVEKYRTFYFGFNEMGRDPSFGGRYCVLGKGSFHEFDNSS
jgi:hypothetical protein